MTADLEVTGINTPPLASGAHIRTMCERLNVYTITSDYGKAATLSIAFDNGWYNVTSCATLAGVLGGVAWMHI